MLWKASLYHLSTWYQAVSTSIKEKVGSLLYYLLASK
jgi:hypothetical protein